MRFDTLRIGRLIAATLLGLLPFGVSAATAEVTDLTARAVASDCIRLQWTGAARVAILRKVEGGPLKRIAVVGDGQNEYVDDALKEGAAYTYRVEEVRDGLRYDFGGRASADRYVCVGPADRYDQARGYGIAPAENVVSSGSRDRGGRGDPKLATLIWRHPTLTFVQDLANGEYRVSLASGDATYEGSASVKINGADVVPLTKTAPGKFVTLDAHKVIVTDGKLTVEIGGHGRLNRLTIDPVSTGNARFAEATARTKSLERSPGNTAYYVDAADGNDEHRGTSPETAWKSFDKLHGLNLAPGDRALLAAGRTFNGPLHPKGSGTAGKPIVIGRYGQGANPIVAGCGKVENTIRLRNQQHWEIRDLTVTNTDGGVWDDAGRTIRRAVYVTAEDAGDVAHIHLQNLEIRDVRGMYRFEGNQTNGGIIAQVTGQSKKTRFVDLRIEGCTFRTKSIDRYPVAVTSSWRKDHPSEIIYRNNRLDHTGRAHIVVPADQWPRATVQYFCPDCNRVFAIAKTAAPACGACGRVGCEDIFGEIAARLSHAWDFFDATRFEKGKWGRFRHRPGADNYSLWPSAALALGTYGELRCMGFRPPGNRDDDKILDEWISAINAHVDPADNLVEGPVGSEAPSGSIVSKAGYVSNGYAWQLRNRVFLADRYVPPVGSMTDVDHFETRESALVWLNAHKRAGSWTTRVIKNHAEILRAQGLSPNHDGMLELAHEWLDGIQDPRTGVWGGGDRINDGLFKIMISYERYDWPINRKKEIVDFVLAHARDDCGFPGSGCSLFDPMMVLMVLRNRGFDYRADEIDAAVGKSFVTVLRNWDERTNWYAGNSWDGKHNNGAPMYMAALLLDQPYWKICTVYNWREGPIVTRNEDGTVVVNKVTYQTKGHPFGG